MTEVLKFAELLSARICHDLASPIGAANNGLEFIGEGCDEETKEQALAIASSGCAQAVARLNFYRYIYGASVRDDDLADLAKIYRLTAAFWADGKLKLHWPTEHMHLKTREAQLLLNLIFIMASTLVKGGDLYIARQDSPKRITVMAKGQGIEFKKDIKLILLKHEQCQITPENVHLHFAAKLAEVLGVSIQYEGQNDGITLWVNFQNQDIS